MPADNGMKRTCSQTSRAAAVAPTASATEDDAHLNMIRSATTMSRAAGSSG